MYTQKPKNTPTLGSSKGYYECLPTDYNTNTKYPLILFTHGLGELGNGTTDLGKILNTGLPSLINQGKLPVIGTTKFIVISPQYINWPGPGQLREVLDYILANYSIDTTRIYLTGLSMGGGATWETAALYPDRFAAIIPCCGASVGNDEKYSTIAKSNLPAFATHNDADGVVGVYNTHGWVDGINKFNPTNKATKVIFMTGGHDCWTKTYDPTWLYNGMNIYQWMLQYTTNRQATNIPSPPPINVNNMKINAGGQAVVINNEQWLADNYFTGTSATAAHAIPSTLPTIYATERYSRNFGYSIPVVNGSYNVKLHFAETFWSYAGQRVFNVTIQGGLPVISNLDLIKTVGKNVALIKEFNVTVANDKININLEGVTDNACIKGIEIIKTDGTTPVPPPTTEKSIKTVITTEYRDAATNELISTITNTVMLK